MLYTLAVDDEEVFSKASLLAERQSLAEIPASVTMEDGTLFGAEWIRCEREVL
jgi:hypothetical protein